MRRVKFEKKSVGASFVALLIVVGIITVLDRLVFPLPMERLNKPSARFVYSRNKSLMGCFISSDGFWRKPVELREISPLLQKSVLACEDHWFYYHPGVNVFSLVIAAIEDVKAGKVIRGGSTITMQIARMMEPKPRTVKSKFVEIMRAFQLELHYSKKELLELYFNLAPYGGNIEGVGAASYFYFEKKPLELTASQAALLTSVPNDPAHLRPDINPLTALAARNRVLSIMRRRAIISSDKYAEALEEEMRSSRTEPPLAAPHFMRDLAQRNPGKTEIISTIDLKIQAACEGVVRNYHHDLMVKNISNIAVVVLKNSSTEVVAMIGSADFRDERHQGQVNGATAPRSPGSALKPFVYAMALDKGLISPNSIIEDLPVYYSGYSPENYDKQYRGAVSAADALRLSLNVPAVTLCARVGQRDFYKLLKAGGISTLHRKDYEYGLPLILGSCEVTLLDLATLYSSLARGGLYNPYQVQVSSDQADAVRLFSTAASYIISEILSELQRPDFPSSWEFSPNIPKVAWKTGTSYGRKDAWCAGYNPDYTVGVWVGNFSGEPSPDLVGAEAAAPILFDIFKSVGQGRNAGWFAQPSSVSRRMVCGLSGKPPNSFCPATVEELYVPGSSPVFSCNIHKEIMVDSISGIRLCRYCASGKHAVMRVFEAWPPKMATWLVRAGKSPAPIPEHNPDCTGTYAGDRPVIVSPNEDVVYVVRGYAPSDQQGIALEASVASSARQIFWFVDGELYGRVKPCKKVFYTPVAGVHKITCTDDEGRSTSITLNIQ